MVSVRRLKVSAKAAVLHFLCCACVALVCAFFVFHVWYPGGYAEVSGGRNLFFILIVVDVVCGPLLTFVVFSPEKSVASLRRDLACVVVIQLIALSYGLYSVMQARPVFLAFEGDRFRVVSQSDISEDGLSKADAKFQKLSIWGPRLVGVKLISAGDAGFLESIRLSLAGLQPAFRPERWVSYDTQRIAVVKRAKPLSGLKRRYPEKVKLIDDGISEFGLSEGEVGFLPLSAYKQDNWIVLVSLKDSTPLVLLPIDGWF